MTKIQLTAKAVWNGLMVMTLGGILSRFVKMTPEFMSVGWSDVSVFIVLCLLLAVFFGLLTNFKIPLQLTGTTSLLIEPDSFVYFAKIQRLLFVFAGLCMGAGFLEAVKKMVMLAVKILPSIQSWISQWVAGDISAVSETAFKGLQDIFYPIAFLLFCVYLLLGADGLVRWQITLLKRFARKEHAHE
jgi:hypothetical protein